MRHGCGRRGRVDKAGSASGTALQGIPVGLLSGRLWNVCPLDFFFFYGSMYTYLTAMRIEQVAAQERYDAETRPARSIGIFGSPTFVVGDEIFWGDDRLEDALEWYRAHSDARMD